MQPSARKTSAEASSWPTQFKVHGFRFTVNGTSPLPNGVSPIGESLLSRLQSPSLQVSHLKGRAVIEGNIMRQWTTKTLLSVLAMACICIAAALPGHAGAFLYASSRREIKVGVLGVGGGTSANPMIFFTMDQRYDVKPRGWEFVNPLNPNAPKNDANYWRVDLSQTVLNNLVKFDVLYICQGGVVNFSLEDLQKLRSFVDAGGLLWYDQLPGAATTFGGTPPRNIIQGLQFKTDLGAPPALVVSRHHPLLSSPFWLNDMEINMLGPGGWSTQYLTNSYLRIGNVGAEPTVLMPVVKNITDTVDTNNEYAFIAAAHFGSGAIVATAGGIGSTLDKFVSNNPVDMNDQNNKRALMYAPMQDLKLAYNAVNLSATWMTLRKDSRRAGSSIEDLGGAMIERWAATSGGNPPTNLETSAAIYKNVFFYADAAGNVYAMDGSPGEDLDQDGNPDDGLQDGNGKPYDVIWTDKCPGGACSAPTVCEIRVGNDAIEAVVVQGANGRLYGWRAFPTNGPFLSGTPAPLPDGPLNSPLYGSSMTGAPSPVAFHDGWIYQVGVDGVFHAYSTTGGTPWVCPNATPDMLGYTYTFKSAPVIGSIINQDNSAALDVAVFTGGPGQNQPNDRIFAIPLAVKNERLRKSTLKAFDTKGYYDSMFSGRQIAESAAEYPEVWATDSDGTSKNIDWPPSPPGGGGVNANGGPGAGGFGVQSSGIAPPTDWIMYANYRLDYPAPGIGGPSPFAYSLRPEFAGTYPNYPAPLKTFGAPALGRDGLICICGSREDGGQAGGAPADAQVGEVQGMQLSFRNDRGNQQWDLRWRYLLHAGIDTAAISTPGVVMDKTLDAAQSDPGVALHMLQPSGSPALVGDKLFVTAFSTGHNEPHSNAALLCFKANPDFIIRVHEPLIDPSTNRKRDVRIWQPDPLFAPGASSPVNDAVHVPSDLIDYRRGTITIRDFAPLTPSANGFQQSPLTPSVPIIVFVDGVQLPPQQVDLSQWNNLLWYMVPYHKELGQRCSGIHSPPVVIGDQVYFQCDDGYVFAVDADTGVSDGKQVFCVPPAYDVNNKDLAKHVKWCYAIGGGAPTAAGKLRASIASANGLMAVVAADGLHGFDNPLTLVADNHRIVELDGAGNQTWTVESIAKVAIDSSGASSMESQTINRPAMAKTLNSGDYIIADTGNNQILHVDRAGNVTWWMDSFIDPNNMLRPGDSLHLNGPTDVNAWAGRESINGTTYNVIHHIIADGGNHRILDIIDRYGTDGSVPNKDAIGNPKHELAWVSRTAEQGKLYEFRNLQLWPDPSPAGMAAGHQFILAGISNYSVFSAPFQTQQPGGSVALLDYRTIDPTSLAVTPRTGLIDPTGMYTEIQAGSEVLPLTGLRYLHRFYTTEGTNVTWHDIICIAKGVYEINSQVITDSKATVATTWLTDGDYQNLDRTIEGSANPIKLKARLVATSAKVLGADRILISNGYSGPFPGMAPFLDGEFTGEVFELQRPASGQPTMMWYAPQIRATEVMPPATPPVFKLQQYTSNGSNIEQPSCVDRSQ